MSTTGNISKATARAKAKGLTIKTNLPINGPTPTIKNGDVFPHIATAPPRKHMFDTTTEKPSMPKRSEAMLNSDWRNNRRQRTDSSDNCELFTAPPEKLTFAEEIQVPKKKLKIDTSAEDLYGPRRYRESPIDSDFIFSAPATKLEFFKALEGDETPPPDEAFETMEPQGNLNPYMKSVVRLESLPHSTRRQLEEILNWDVTTDWGSATAVSPYVLLNKSDKEVNFPFAEIHAVKNSKRLHAAGWDGIDKEIRKTLETLIEPRSAGLPVDKLRVEYEKGQRALAKKAAFDSSAAKSFDVDGNHGTEEQNRFDALIGKLQKSAANRLRGYSSTMTGSCKLSPVAKDQEKDAQGKLEGFMKATTVTTLNPKALEFFSTGQSQQPGYMTSAHQANQPLIDDEKEPRPAPTFADWQFLMTRIEELEAQVKGQPPAASHQQIPVAPVAQQNSGQNFTGDFATLPGMPTMAPRAPEAMRTGPEWNAPAAGTTPSTFQQQMPFNTAHMQPAGFDHHNNKPLPPPGFQQGFNTHGSVMPTSTCPGVQPPGPQMAGHAALPSGPNGMPFGPPAHQQNTAPTPTPMIARSMFGPKPVRKPRGPFRPGDPQQARHQQQYEEYLEWRRYNDPEYAQKCKTRQARRAGRQSSG